MPKSKIVGQKIKSLRESKNITQVELSERSGLSVDQISSIEENINIPSLAPLIKIARVLGVRLGTFLDDSSNLGPVVCRKEEKSESMSFSNNSTNAHKHMQYFSLCNSKSDRHMEPFVINIEPSKEADFILSTHEGEEFIYVIEGVLEIKYGKETFILEEGDSIYYDSIVSHHVHAYQGSAAKILAVVYMPF